MIWGCCGYPICWIRYQCFSSISIRAVGQPRPVPRFARRYFVSGRAVGHWPDMSTKPAFLVNELTTCTRKQAFECMTRHSRKCAGAESAGVDNLWALSRHGVRLFGSTETTKPLHFCRGFVLYGAGTRSRTRDLLITRKVLTTYKSMTYMVCCYVQARQSPRSMRASTSLLRGDFSLRRGIQRVGSSRRRPSFSRHGARWPLACLRDYRRYP